MTRLKTMLWAWLSVLAISIATGCPSTMPVTDTGDWVVYDGVTGNWVRGEADALEPGDEARLGDGLYLWTSEGPTLVGEATAEELAAADQSWSGQDEVPGSTTWVRTLGSESRHVRLDAVTPGERIAWRGRVFETRGEPTTGVTSVRATGEVVQRVSDRFTRVAPATWTATVQHADGSLDAVTATEEHPVWSPDLGRWVRFDELRPGVGVQTQSGAVATVVDVAITEAATPVFNFEVVGRHNYLVAGGEGVEGLLVHNSKCDLAGASKGGGAFHVTPEGVALPPGKDVNLVPTAQGQKGDFIQIHQTHTDAKAQGGFAHTHKPEVHTAPDGTGRTTRTTTSTTADDINQADAALKDGTLRERTSRKDKGDIP